MLSSLAMNKMIHRLREEKIQTRRYFLIKTTYCASIFFSPIPYLLVGCKETSTESPKTVSILEDKKQPTLHTGMVKYFSVIKGRGFIVQENGDDLFVHHTAIKGSKDGIKTLSGGDEVEFEIVGNKAINVVVTKPAPKDAGLTVRIDGDACAGCELCEETCPEVFKMNSDYVAVVMVNPVPEDFQEACRQAAFECPMEAIEINF